MNNINKYIVNYKKQLEIGDIQRVYKVLLNYVMTLKAYFDKTQSDRFSSRHISIEPLP